MANTANTPIKTSHPHHIFKPGDRIIFPEVNQLLKRGWVYDPVRCVMDNPKAPAFLTDEMLQFAAGKELEVSAIIEPITGCYKIACDLRRFTWPLDFTCMDSAASSDLDHTCTRGQTPIGDFWICKICGRDMERFR